MPAEAAQAAQSNKVKSKNRNTWLFHALVFCAAVAVIVARRPDAIFHAQFFAEDGTIWYAQAYNSGFASLFAPYRGYYNLLPRLAGLLALLFPLQFVPLLLNTVAIIIQAIPVNLLLSSRASGLGSSRVRAYLAVLYLLLPNSREIDANITNAQWHLGLIAIILVLAPPPRTAFGKFVSCATIFVIALTGPFSILLLPIVFVFWRLRQSRWQFISLSLVAATALVQLGAFILTSQASRSNQPLGASPVLLAKILAGRVYLAVLLGGDNTFALQNDAVSLFVVALAASLGTAFIIYVAWQSQLEVKLFLLFSLLALAGSLISPETSVIGPRWQTLLLAPQVRYWFFPTIAFVFCLIWCVSARHTQNIQLVALLGLILTSVGIIRDFHYTPFEESHFEDGVRGFAQAAPGTLFGVPEVPFGAWFAPLVKHLASGERAQLTGRVDEPSAGTHVSDHLFVRGWAEGLVAIWHIVIFVDGRVAKSIELSSPRPDVDNIFCNSPDKNKGWSTMLDTSKLSLGKHQIEVRAVAAGHETTLGGVPIERVP